MKEPEHLGAAGSRRLCFFKMPFILQKEFFEIGIGEPGNDKYERKADDDIIRKREQVKGLTT